jgi:hypothetical protein
LFWFVRFWYQLTVKHTRAKNVHWIRYFRYPYEIAKELKFGEAWKEDPLKGAFDYMPHPTVIQDHINHNKPLDDCDGHAIYWAANLLNSNLASKVWIGTVHMKKKDGTISGHCVCLFEDFLNKHYWCDYSEPRQFVEGPTIFTWPWLVAEEYDARPIAAGFFQVKEVQKDYTPIFSTKVYSKVFKG